MSEPRAARKEPYFRARVALALAMSVALQASCASQKFTCSPSDLSGCVVDEVTVIGNDALSDEEITSKIATAATGTILEGVPVLGAVDALTVQPERFDRFVLSRDLERVARLYRAKGYYEANVRVGRVRRIDGRPKGNSTDVKTARLLVEIVVDEKAPVILQRRSLTWDPKFAPDRETTDAAMSALGELPLGEVFTEESYLDAERAIGRALENLGFAHARLAPRADVDLITHSAEVVYAIDLGPRCSFGKVDILGLEGVPEWQVRPALGFVEGEAFSLTKLEDAEIALRNLGVFGSIAIEPVVDATRAPVVPVRIHVRPAALGAVRLGGGGELGDQVAARGVLGWQHKNATGALDRFGIEARPRLLFYPWRLTTLFAETPVLIPEIAVRLQYALPFPSDPRTTLVVTSQAAAGLPANEEPIQTLERNYNIYGEYLLSHRQGLERRFFGSRLYASLTHNISFSTPFLYPRSDGGGSSDVYGIDSLLFSYLEAAVELDLRLGKSGAWDSKRPVAGLFAAINTQVSGFFLGGDADDVKFVPEVRWYAPLGKHVVLAGRLMMGLLYASNYGFSLDTPLKVDAVASDSNVLRRVNRDISILERRGLYQGGPNSNRGYGFNKISPVRALDDSGNLLPEDNYDAVGGRTSWGGNVELRFPIFGPVGGVGFVDFGDVTRGFAELRGDHPHVSTGAGVRYETPVGPLRIDGGFQVPYLQEVGVESPGPCGAADVCSDYILEGTDLGYALSIAIGNAF